MVYYIYGVYIVHITLEKTYKAQRLEPHGQRVQELYLQLLTTLAGPSVSVTTLSGGAKDRRGRSWGYDFMFNHGGGEKQVI